MEAEHQHTDVFSSFASKHVKAGGPRTHLLPVQLPEALPQLHEGGLHAGVVGQRQQRVGVAYRGHRAQARLPALLVPPHEGQ